MQQWRELPFWKMSGSGNDFLVIDHRKPVVAPEDVRAFVSKLCRRGLSVGADGVIFIETSQSANYAWRYFNADGGEADMCANGSRCAARFAYLTQIAPAVHTFETKAGLVHAKVLGERVQVNLPPPFDLCLHVDGMEGEPFKQVSFINTGVPHAVIFMDDVDKDVDKIDVVSQGRRLRYHPRFAPQGTNVNFVQVLDRHTLKIRTYERGVEDETLACGTGCIAASLIATLSQDVTVPVSLKTRGAITLEVTFTREEGGAYTDVMLTGDAQVVYTGLLKEGAFA